MYSGAQNNDNSLVDKLQLELEKLKEMNSSLNNTINKNNMEFEEKHVENQQKLLQYEGKIESIQETVCSRDTVISERNQTIENLRNRNTELEAQVESIQNEVHTSKSEHTQTKILLKDAITEKDIAIQEKQEINKKYNELIIRITRESEVTAKALEKAISSSVRLCVVAPTVNVHIADKKLRMQSK